MSTHQWHIKNTAANKGRNIFVTPETSDFKFLSAGRIILDSELSQATARNEGSETILLVLHGSGRVKVAGETYEVARFDGVYIPRGEEFTVQTDDAIDILEGNAPTELVFPPAHVRHEETKTQEGMHLKVGSPPFYRDLHKVIAENVQGAKLLMGFTMSAPGNWTSWPPHEHAGTQEELYLFFDMPRYGTQYVYTDIDQPEMIAPVKEDDAVVIVKGYHPNVAVPGYPINFVWLLCSLEDTTYRRLGGVNVHPDFLMETGLR